MSLLSFCLALLLAALFLPAQPLTITLDPFPTETAAPTPSPTTNTFSESTESTTTATTSVAPSPSDSPPPVSDLVPLVQRRVALLVDAATQASSIQTWLDSLDQDGKWPDSQINYTSGCDAQRANWPAGGHWNRINTMAAAWHGPMSGAARYQNNSDLLAAISRAMDWWFQRDFTTMGCLDQGGSQDCPCDTPGLWNTNWYSNVILVPTAVAANCLLLSPVLSDTQRSNCSNIGLRSYGTFGGGQGYLAGANILDISNVGIDTGFFNMNVSLVTEAYQRVHDELVIQDKTNTDGILPDGSFGQHIGLLYNGNYGKDFTNAVMSLETVAASSRFAADDDAISALTIHLDGSRWMVYMNTKTQVIHWDFSALPRFISFPVVEGQATAGLKMNLTRLNLLANAWDSDVLMDVYEQLTEESSSANVGPLVGMRYFWRNDYFVSRGDNYVTTIKGYSSRTVNTECTNSQNPFGFHLADALTYTYVEGDEYEDIAAAWDWNLLPGTTVDYNATQLSCNIAKWPGNETFVGGATAGGIGVFAMRYTNPASHNLTWQKATFFFKNDVQHVIVSNVTSMTDAPIFSVLDQKRRSGITYVDFTQAETGNYSDFTSLWHNNVGYAFNYDLTDIAELSLALGPREGKWSSIGTSKQPPTTVDLFSAWLHHTDLSSPLSYTIFPGADLREFRRKWTKTNLITLQSDGNADAILDVNNQDLIIVFWAADEEVAVPDFRGRAISITSDQPAVLLLSRDFKMTVSDPSQTAFEVNFHVKVLEGRPIPGWSSGREGVFKIELPHDSFAGSPVTFSLSKSK